MANTGVIENGVKMAGEVLLPGASLLLDGNIKSGAGHAIVGLAAWAFLGPARFLVAANSFSKSVTDEHLHSHLWDLAKSGAIAINASTSGLVKSRKGTGDEAAAGDTAEAAAPA